MSPLDTGGLTTGTDGRKRSGKGQGPLPGNGRDEGRSSPEPRQRFEKENPGDGSGNGSGVWCSTHPEMPLGSSRNGRRVPGGSSVGQDSGLISWAVLGPKSDPWKATGRDESQDTIGPGMSPHPWTDFSPISKTIFPVFGKKHPTPTPLGWSSVASTEDSE
jgi:hypothetical protein